MANNLIAKTFQKALTTITPSSGPLQKSGTYDLTSLPSSFRSMLAESTTVNPHGWLNWKKYNPRLNPVEKIANDMAAICLYQEDAEGNQTTDTPAMELLRNPSKLPGLSGFQVMKAFHTYYEILGEAFLFITKNKQNEWMIIPIPPTWVCEIPCNTTDPYIINMSDGHMRAVPNKQIIYHKNIDIQDPLSRGFGYAQALGDEIQVDEYMAKHQGNFFKQGAKIPAIVSIANASPEDIEQVKNSYLAKYAGLNNAHIPWFIPGESMSVSAIAQSMKDADFLNSRIQNKKDAREFFGIPPELMGDTSGSNRATITAAQTIYAKNVLYPRLQSLLSTLNTQYAPLFMPTYEIVAENIIPEDEEFNLTKSNDGWDKGTMTLDEWREANGLDPLPGKQGQVLKSALMDVFTPVSDSDEAPAMSTPQSDEEELIIDIEVDDQEKKNLKAPD